MVKHKAGLVIYNVSLNKFKRHYLTAAYIKCQTREMEQEQNMPVREEDIFVSYAVSKK